eukprot:15466309-Alexandrium_andersonii.AAC.1
MSSDEADLRIADWRIADCCSHCTFPAGLTPPGPPPEKRLRRARRPVSSSPSDSARKMTPNPPDEALQGGFRCCFGLRTTGY